MNQPTSNSGSDVLPAIDIDNLRKSYGSGEQAVHALNGISLRVEQGDFFALLGPNGAGKSTTIGILCSLVNKSSGRVSIHGVDIDDNFSLAKQYIGVVPQEFNFSQFEKVIDIVVTQAGFYGLSLTVAQARAEHYLKQLGLWEKRDQRARMLSGGMKRRLMIARALIHQPRVLILDEPTAGVDVELRRQMWTFLTELNAQGTTIILTTHYLEEAEQLCRNMAIIDHGDIVAQGAIKTLLEKLECQQFLLEVDAVPSTLVQFSQPGFELSATSETTITAEVVGRAALNPLLLWLQDQSCQILSIQTKTNRLEELFVRITH